MGGYAYGESPPVTECGRCGGEAHAEYCDVGVGYVQASEFMCSSCGAVPIREEGHTVWKSPPSPTVRGEAVTGYVVTAEGFVIETTFDHDHEWLFRRMGTNRSRLVSDGGVRITNLEGFAIDLPPFMSRRARRALARVLKAADWSWGDPYVLPWGADRGREMSRGELAAFVSRLPESRPETASAPSP